MSSKPDEEDELTSEEVYLLQTIDFKYLPYCFCRHKPDEFDIAVLNQAVKQMISRGFIHTIIEMYNGTPTYKLTETGMAIVKLMRGTDFG